MENMERSKTMPGFDGTGPRGKGPLTGRGMGYCAIPLRDTAQPQSGPARPYPAILIGRASRQSYSRGYGFARGAGFARGKGRGGWRGGRHRWR